MTLSGNGNEKPLFHENTNGLTKSKLEYQRQRLKIAGEYFLWFSVRTLILLIISKFLCFSYLNNLAAEPIQYIRFPNP